LAHAKVAFTRLLRFRNKLLSAEKEAERRLFLGAEA
jgi:hypothetical protein